MSDIGGAGNGAFDTVFIALEILFALFLLGSSLVRAARAARWVGVAQVLVGIVACVGLPLFWNGAFPPHDGIEGAGRFLFGTGASAINAMLFCGARQRRVNTSRRSAFVEFMAVGCASALYWSYFVRS